MFRGLYPIDAEGYVTKALHVREMGHRQPAVLDIGSGSGIWYVAGALYLIMFYRLNRLILLRATEMANKFPHARVIGIDLALSRPG